MNSETIVMCVVALILGMLLANMLKSVCGCKVVEGQDCTPFHNNCYPDYSHMQARAGVDYILNTAPYCFQRNAADEAWTPLDEQAWRAAGTPDIPRNDPHRRCCPQEAMIVCSKRAEDMGPKPVDCEGSWNEWSACSEECGGGTQSRTYNISAQAAGGGNECHHTNGQTESKECNTQECCSADADGRKYNHCFPSLQVLSGGTNDGTIPRGTKFMSQCVNRKADGSFENVDLGGRSVNVEKGCCSNDSDTLACPLSAQEMITAAQCTCKPDVADTLAKYGEGKSNWMSTNYANDNEFAIYEEICENIPKRATASDCTQAADFPSVSDQNLQKLFRKNGCKCYGASAASGS